jgi:hypothetical protein
MLFRPNILVGRQPLAYVASFILSSIPIYLRNSTRCAHESRMR